MGRFKRCIRYQRKGRSKLNKAKTIVNKIVDRLVEYGTPKSYFTGGASVERVDPEELKKELFDGIPEEELSEDSKRKLNLIMGVQCDAGKTVIRQVMKEELKTVNLKLDKISKTQTTMGNQIKAIKKEVGGLGNGS